MKGSSLLWSRDRVGHTLRAAPRCSSEEGCLSSFQNTQPKLVGELVQKHRQGCADSQLSRVLKGHRHGAVVKLARTPFSFRPGDFAFLDTHGWARPQVPLVRGERLVRLLWTWVIPCPSGSKGSPGVCSALVPTFREGWSVVRLIATPTAVSHTGFSDRVAIMATTSVFVEEGGARVSPMSRGYWLVWVNNGLGGCHRLRLLLFRECSSGLSRDAGEISFLFQAREHTLQEGNEETQEFASECQHQGV